MLQLGVSPNLIWLHRYWWRRLKTECVGDKFKMFVTSHLIDYFVFGRCSKIVKKSVVNLAPKWYSCLQHGTLVMNIIFLHIIFLVDCNYRLDCHLFIEKSYQYTSWLKNGHQHPCQKWDRFGYNDSGYGHYKLHGCWWFYVSEHSWVITEFQYWWHIGDIENVVDETDHNRQNIFKSSLTNFVSNICHQHRFSFHQKLFVFSVEYANRVRIR